MNDIVKTLEQSAAYRLRSVKPEFSQPPLEYTETMKNGNLRITLKSTVDDNRCFIIEAATQSENAKHELRVHFLSMVFQYAINAIEFHPSLNKIKQ